MKSFYSLVSFFVFFLVISQYPVYSDTADFFNAIRKGDVKLVDEYLSGGIKADSVVENNKTALMIATQAGHLPIVKLLIDYGADVNRLNDSKNSALHFAVYNRHNAIVEYLVEKGALMDIRGYQDQTPLILASEIDNKEAIKFLVGKGANILLFDKKDYTALTYTYFTQDKEIVSFLKIRYEKNLKKKDKREFGNAVLSFDARAITRYTGLGINVDQPAYYNEENYDIDDETVKNYSTTALLESLKNRNDELTVLSIKAGACVNEVRYDERCGYHPVRSPINYSLGGSLKIVKMILDAGAKDLNESLFLTCDVAEIKLLVEHNADINCYFLGRTPLHAAAGSGCRESVLFLLENGVDINAKVKEYDSYFGYNSADGETPLMIAVREGHADIVKILIDNGADSSIKVTVSDENKEKVYTALDLAKEYDNQEIIRLLTEAKKKR